MEVGGLGSVVLVSICSDRIRLRAIADNAFCFSFNGVASVTRESPTVFILSEVVEQNLSKKLGESFGSHVNDMSF